MAGTSERRLEGWRACILCICLALFLAGCGSSPAKEIGEDLSRYRNGALLVDLADEDTYYFEGRKLAEVMERSIELVNRTADAFRRGEMDEIAGEVVEQAHAVEFHPEFLKVGYYKQTVNESECTFYGKMKDNRPEGYGVLASGSRIYAGNFKEGNLYGYGICIDQNGALAFEGYIDGITRDGEYRIADGEAAVPFGWDTLSIYYGWKWGEGFGWSDRELDEAAAAYGFAGVRLLPEYIGGIKKQQYHGKGTLYDEEGRIIYEGEFKKGKYDGKGILYYPDGSVMYEGGFSRGEYHGKGTLYYQNGSVEYKGNFKRGEVD